MAINTSLEVPADPRWRHVVAATVLSAVRASRGHRSGVETGARELGQMGDLSLLLDRALDDIDELAGVRQLRVVVEADGEWAEVTVFGEGDDIEYPAWLNHADATPLHPVAGTFDWHPSQVRCRFRVS